MAAKAWNRVVVMVAELRPRPAEKTPRGAEGGQSRVTVVSALSTPMRMVVASGQAMGARRRAAWRHARPAARRGAIQTALITRAADSQCRPGEVAGVQGPDYPIAP